MPQIFFGLELEAASTLLGFTLSLKKGSCAVTVATQLYCSFV